MNDPQWLFLRSQFLASSISAALGRAKVYRPTATAGEAAILRAEMRSVLLELGEQYSCHVTEGDHVRSIWLLADRVSARCGQFLENNGRLRFGVAQAVEGVARAQSGARSGAQSDRVLRAVSEGVGSAQELATILGLRSKTGALKFTLNELLGNGLIELTIRHKPSSRLQRYRITPHGLEILKRSKETK